MSAALRTPLRPRLRDFLRRRFTSFHDINVKYAKPRIPPTGWVRLALIGLLLYLFTLLSIFAFKFITLTFLPR